MHSHAPKDHSREISVSPVWRALGEVELDHLGAKRFLLTLTLNVQGLILCSWYINWTAFSLQRAAPGFSSWDNEASENNPNAILQASSIEAGITYLGIARRGREVGSQSSPCPPFLPHTCGVLFSLMEDGLGHWELQIHLEQHLLGHTGPVSVKRYSLCS